MKTRPAPSHSRVTAKVREQYIPGRAVGLDALGPQLPIGRGLFPCCNRRGIARLTCVAGCKPLHRESDVPCYFAPRNAWPIAASAIGAMTLYPAGFGCRPSSASSFLSKPFLSARALK